jgi:methionyl-tRNA synthetase
MPHKQWLLDLIDSRSKAGNPLVVPDFRVGELRNAVEKLESDLCISRPASRLQWGIPFPESFGAGFVTYVWFDALVNYISFAPGYSPIPASPFTNHEFHRWWPALHVIGKDIMIPAHGVYWPIMLKALGFDGDDIPQLIVHGWWNISGAKMSKSLGNVVDPDLLADKYGAEAVRYYLVSDIATGKDADFSEERLIQRYNGDLANSLGNLLNRSLNMAAKYQKGRLIKTSIEFRILDVLASEPGFNPADTALTEDDIYSYYFHLVTDGYTTSLDGRLWTLGRPRIQAVRWDVGEALHAVGEMASVANKLVEREAPWKLAKDLAQAERLDAVLYHLAESLRIIAILLSPVLPKAAHGIFDQLKWKMGEQGQETRFRLADATWGGLPDGHVLGTPTPLFPRIETEAKPT